MSRTMKGPRITDVDIRALETIYADGRALAFVIEEQRKEITELRTASGLKDRKIRMLGLQLNIVMRSAWSRRGYEKRIRKHMEMPNRKLQ